MVCAIRWLIRYCSDAIKTISTDTFAGSTAFSAALLVVETETGLIDEQVQLVQLGRDIGLPTLLTVVDQPREQVASGTYFYAED